MTTGKVRMLSGVAALGAILWSLHGYGQELPPTPVPVVPSASNSPAPAPGGQSPETVPQYPASSPISPAPLMPPALLYTPISPYQDNNGPLLRGDPLLDRPHSPGPGCFWALELNVVAPQIKNRLQAPVAINSPILQEPGIQGFLPNLVHLPTAELDWTGAPRFELGYRFPEGFGELLLSYRFLVTEGRDVIPYFDFGDDGFLKSRLDMHAIDLDYGSREFSLDPHWDMKWRAGVRLANVYFDSLAVGFFREESTTNHFIGAGPHVGLDLWRTLDIPGLGLFLRLEGASVIGQISQGFERIVADDTSVAGGATLVHHTQAVPVLHVQAGLNWAPWYGRTRFALGYEFERWWTIGEAADSRAELTTQGIFMRAEVGF
ncbi:MAG TPA: Lpg1974 family pore-forming outer membrane protein [Gemmataceae bacterium]|nr:Lpg1974 family pore-forming outer membrane protein [Gemmataceae bacterium]